VGQVPDAEALPLAATDTPIWVEAAEQRQQGGHNVPGYHSWPLCPGSGQSYIPRGIAPLSIPAV